MADTAINLTVIDPAALAGRLPALDAILRANGFKPDPARWVAVHDLLVRLGRDGELPAVSNGLRALLAPLLCASPDQQADFASLFAQWADGAQSAKPITRIDRSEAAATSTVAYQRKTRMRPVLLALLGLFLAVVAGAFAWQLMSSTETDSKGGTATKRPPPEVTSPGPVGQNPTEFKSKIPHSTDPAAPRDRRRTAFRNTPAGVSKPPSIPCAWVSSVCQFCSWSVGWLQMVRRRKVVLESGAAADEDPLVHLRLKGGTRRAFWGGRGARRIASATSRRASHHPPSGP